MHNNQEKQLNQCTNRVNVLVFNLITFCVAVFEGCCVPSSSQFSSRRMILIGLRDPLVGGKLKNL